MPTKPPDSLTNPTKLEQGTTTAIVSSYVLAGEISECLEDIPQALRNYESIVKPFVQQVQSLPPGAPQILNPQTSYGITILKYSLSIASSWWFRSAVSRIMAWWPKSRTWKLPTYNEVSEVLKE